MRIFSRIILEDRGRPLKEVETLLELLRSALDAFRDTKRFIFMGAFYADIS